MMAWLVANRPVNAVLANHLVMESLPVSRSDGAGRQTQPAAAKPLGAYLTRLGGAVRACRPAELLRGQAGRRRVHPLRPSLAASGRPG